MSKVTIDSIVVAADEVSFHLVDQHPATVGFFHQLPEEQHAEVAVLAWNLGLRALATAHVHADTVHFETTWKQSLEDMKDALETFVDDKSPLAQLFQTQRTGITDDIKAALDPNLDQGGVKPFLEKIDEKLTQHTTTIDVKLAEYDDKSVARDNAMQQAITRIETKGREAKKTPPGGNEFQDFVLEIILDEMRGTPWAIDDVGANPGDIPNCKVGDVVLEATADSAFAGARVVVEDKQKKDVTETAAIKESDLGRKNRRGDVGLFVMAESHKRPDFPFAARHGRDVLVVWNENDPQTDIRLRCALWLATALVPLKNVGDQGDINALADIRGLLEAQFTRLTKLEAPLRQIQSGHDTIAREIGEAQTDLQITLGKLKTAISALKTESRDEATERRTPITLREPPISLADTMGMGEE